MGNNSGKPIVFTDEVNLNHFRLLRVVGKGAFGKVRIVERKDTGLTFALKYIRKDEVVKSESVRNIIRERRMLEQLNHPFICNLRYSFQDIEYLYIVVDLMNGGDLRFHINRKTFTEDAIRFWIAEMACALEYVHQRNIVHRDVKPDNILLDSDGHVHLADFNVASDYSPNHPLTSKSGTLAYLAPEVYAGKGYDTAVDWWSLGVVFYECVYGKRPFISDSHEELAKEIMKATPAYPVTNPPVSPDCISALKSLLCKDPKIRIGAAGLDSIKNHPFFASIDFDKLMLRELEPVFVPSKDKTNFDATYDLEELLLEEAPLEARARRQRPREQLRNDATAQEIRAEELHKMIETLFEPFDYTAAVYDKYPGTIDPVTKSVGPPPAWAKSTDKVAEISNGKDHKESTSSDASNEGKEAQSSMPVPNHPTPPKDDCPLVVVQKASVHDLSDHSRPSTPPANVPRRPSTAGTLYRPATSPPDIQKRTSTSLEKNGQNNAPNGDKATSPKRAATEVNKSDGARPKSSMLGFLHKRRGRGHSPKPMERGVLGREGARIIVG